MITSCTSGRVWIVVVALATVSMVARAQDKTGITLKDYYALAGDARIEQFKRSYDKVVETNLKLLKSPVDKDEQPKTAEQIAKDRKTIQDIGIVVTEADGEERIGNLVYMLASAYEKNPDTYVEKIIAAWLTYEINELRKSRRLVGVGPSLPRPSTQGGLLGSDWWCG